MTNLIATFAKLCEELNLLENLQVQQHYYLLYSAGVTKNAPNQESATIGEARKWQAAALKLF